MPEKDPELIADPVSGFSIPLSWIESCSDPRAREKILSGRWTILSSGLLLKRGLTTGTTAAAAAKGAVVSLVRATERLEVMTPAGIPVSVSVKAENGYCNARKDGGDHQSDVTAGLEISARAEPSGETVLLAGAGIGRIGAGGLCDQIGRPAISPSAKGQIMMAISEGLKVAGLEHVRVEIWVPQGERISRQTLNPKLGITGGISILGSTGFVEPWNEHLINERAEELKGAKRVVVSTGRTGLKLSRILFPDHEAVLMGNQLGRLEFEPDQESILCGLPALILKWAWPEILENTGYNTVAEMVEKEPEHENIALGLRRAKEKLPYTRIVLLHRNGRILLEAP